MALDSISIVDSIRSYFIGKGKAYETKVKNGTTVDDFDFEGLWSNNLCCVGVNRSKPLVSQLMIDNFDFKGFGVNRHSMAKFESFTSDICLEFSLGLSSHLPSGFGLVPKSEACVKIIRWLMV